jgi:hypothetical protein
MLPPATPGLSDARNVAKGGHFRHFIRRETVTSLMGSSA